MPLENRVSVEIPNTPIIRSKKSERLRHGGNWSIYTHAEQHDKNTREQREAAHNGPGLLVNKNIY